MSNAGVACSQAPFSEQSLEVARKTMEINYFAHFIVAQKAIPHLEKVKGNIVFTSSSVGILVV